MSRNVDVRFIPTHNPARWTRPDGSFDVLAYCRWLDDNTNAGAGPLRDAGKPGLTCGNASEQKFDGGTLGSQNRVLPAPLPTARELADPPTTGADNG